MTAGLCVIDMLLTTILFLCVKDLWQTQVKGREGGGEGGREGPRVAWVYLHIQQIGSLFEQDWEGIKVKARHVVVGM